MLRLVEALHIESSPGDDLEFELLVLIKSWTEEHSAVATVDSPFAAALADTWNWTFLGVFVGGSVRILLSPLEANTTEFSSMVSFDCPL